MEPRELSRTPADISSGNHPSSEVVASGTPVSRASRGTPATAAAPSTPTPRASQVPSRTTRRRASGSSRSAVTKGITPRTAPETAAIAGK